MTGKWAAGYQTTEGYSLAELLVVLACLIALLSMAVPDIARLQKTWTLWGGMQSLESSLQWGRMHAIASNTPMLFEVSTDGQEFGWRDPDSGDRFEATFRHLGKDLRIVSAPRRPLRFYPRGNAAPAGTYVIEGDAESYSVVVAPGGRIRTQKN